jgi:hypothetical protein
VSIPVATGQTLAVGAIVAMVWFHADANEVVSSTTTMWEVAERSALPAPEVKTTRVAASGLTAVVRATPGSP